MATFKRKNRTAENGDASAEAAPTISEVEIDLRLPEGEWWRPWEDGDTEVIVRLERLRKGEFGEYFVARSMPDGGTLFINIHAMLEGLKKFLNRTVKIEYLGKDETRGRNGVHTYRAALMTAGRAAARPNRPARPDAEPDASDHEA